MKDKQIIFDDVDVKDCIAYAKSQTVYLGSTVYKQMEKVCMVKNQPCELFDCQFKQMARELKAKEQRIVELNKTIQAKEQECKNNKTAYQMELDIFNQECLNLLEELKAKEQECEELKKQHQADKGLITSTGKMNYQLLQEYDKLKAENKELKNQIEDVDVLCSEKESLIDKCLQTLTDIKEIAEHCIKQDICTTCDNSEKCHIEDEEIPTYDVCKLILQKISECEVNDE
jgi:chromosome segregation ATPase